MAENVLSMLSHSKGRPKLRLLSRSWLGQLEHGRAAAALAACLSPAIWTVWKAILGIVNLADTARPFPDPLGFERAA
jgi:hypothetical protein